VPDKGAGFDSKRAVKLFGVFAALMNSKVQVGVYRLPIGLFNDTADVPVQKQQQMKPRHSISAGKWLRDLSGRPLLHAIPSLRL
jgi:hypothetical protein